jgi:hypothetical protein
MVHSAVFPTSRPTRRGRATTIAIGTIVASMVLGLAVAGITFGALAVAFQIVIPIAGQYHVSFTADDIALAQRVGAFWWVFGALSIASFVGAGLVAVKSIRYLDSAPGEA